jgi:hypothetical protein
VLCSVRRPVTTLDCVLLKNSIQVFVTSIFEPVSVTRTSSHCQTLVKEYWYGNEHSGILGGYNTGTSMNSCIFEVNSCTMNGRFRIRSQAGVPVFATQPHFTAHSAPYSIKGLLSSRVKRTQSRTGRSASCSAVDKNDCSLHKYFQVPVINILLLLLLLLLFSLALQPSVDYGLLVHEVSWSHTTTRHSR